MLEYILFYNIKEAFTHETTNKSIKFELSVIPIKNKFLPSFFILKSLLFPAIRRAIPATFQTIFFLKKTKKSCAICFVYLTWY